MFLTICRAVGVSLLGAGSIALLSALPAGAAPPMYVAVPLGSLGGVQSEGHAINQAGHATGLAFVHGDAAYHAFLTTSSGMADLGSPTGGSSTGTGINAHDDVVLNSSITIPPQPFGFPLVEWYAFRYSNGVTEPLDDGVQAMVTGINDAGVVVWDNASGSFRGSAAPFTALQGIAETGGINATAAVAGAIPSDDPADGTHAATLDAAGNLRDLGTIGNESSVAVAINDRGDATGFAYARDPATGIEHTRALLYSAGQITDLGSLDSAYVDTRGEGINNAGVVVGTATDPMTIQNRGFIYADGRMYDLNARVISGLGNSILWDAAGINDAGQIIATACGSIGTCQAFRLDPVTSIPPAPQPVAMIEYYEPTFDHYFMTSLPVEIKALDEGKFPGWQRTGQSFEVYPTLTIGADSVCRFFNADLVPSSHFYSADPNECLFTENHPGWTWQLEGIVAYIAVPDDAGQCPASTNSVYRLYNDGKGGAPNHRYTTSTTIRATMMAQGWIPEGYGDGVVMCAPSS